ncbi:Putative metallophosphoesterase MG207 homolog [Turicibacter sanguinis]|nr:Putative metallophosphoesterase MG207 homolog [Turicibacter sanguinis]
MKIVVVSDSHADVKSLKLIRERHLHDADLFIHCGDSQLMSNHPDIQGYLTVRGNCDLDQQYPLHRVEKLNHRETLFMTHGHQYDVKYSMQRLYYKALEVGATIVCYGHSHCIGAEMNDGILFVNPGSLVLPRNTREKTYATITLNSHEVEIEYLEVGTGERLIYQKFNR